jgi:redox-sensitive bicupin YhaK (pirin superfamily)
VAEPIIELRRGADRFVTTVPGIVSRHSFSYGPHYDPHNVGHGRLMVCNEESLAVGAGFPDHPHADAEIVTWVLEGSLVHEDSYGNAGVIHPGLAQRMSAGAGIVHSEQNDGYLAEPARPIAPVRFVQMWLRPDDPGGQPSYEQRELDLSDLDGGWVPVAAGDDQNAAIGIATKGATLWVTRLAAGSARNLPEGATAHAFVAAGEVAVEGVGRLTSGDALRLTGPAAVRIESSSPAELLVWTMPA